MGSQSNHMRFPTEQHLVTSFVSQLSTSGSPFGAVKVAMEFDYRRGRADIVASTECHAVIAIEAKLQDWRTALHQAFRNRCFANRSYVLLPKTIAERAAQYAGEFERRQVGICYVDDGEIVVLHHAPTSDPFEPWLAARARVHIESLGIST